MAGAEAASTAATRRPGSALVPGSGRLRLMSIPDSQTLMRPLLELAADGQEARLPRCHFALGESIVGTWQNLGSIQPSYAKYCDR
jgi:hypothetical protein